MIAKFLEGHENPKFILIEDTINRNGKNLLNAFLKHYIKRDIKVHLLLFDFPSDDSGSLYKEELNQSDPLGWNGTCNTNGRVITNYNIQPILEDLITQENENIIITVDGLSNVLLHISMPEIYQMFHKLLSHSCKVKQVVALVHKDVHDSGTVTALEHLASAVIQVHASEIGSSLMICHTLYKKPTGKVLREEEQLCITDSHDIKNIEIPLHKKVVRPEPIIHQTPDPAANLTFNLTLKDDEKKARDQLVLPYTREAVSLSSGGTGKIFYEPDEADDLDEDDPDDDLDI
ncbi:elongator complex protein 5 isoform X2 [Tachypleus tridentatus]|uniref:elongator complex protein 5 isoform X2 n=1 Tax=Tachypleus tridentatus TaxID=6853 RepID=UPI003FD22D35